MKSTSGSHYIWSPSGDVGPPRCTDHISTGGRDSTGTGNEIFSRFAIGTIAPVSCFYRVSHNLCVTCDFVWWVGSIQMLISHRNIGQNGSNKNSVVGNCQANILVTRLTFQVFLIVRYIVLKSEMRDCEIRPGFTFWKIHKYKVARITFHPREKL